jgi:hypothetical protein
MVQRHAWNCLRLLSHKLGINASRANSVRAKAISPLAMSPRPINCQGGQMPIRRLAGQPDVTDDPTVVSLPKADVYVTQLAQVSAKLEPLLSCRKFSLSVQATQILFPMYLF